MDVTAQVNQLRNMSTMIQIEIRENERLGAHIYDLAKNMCSDREQEKYFIFVKDVDKIVNLLLSLTGRLSRVENAIKNLPMDAEKDELVGKNLRMASCVKVDTQWSLLNNFTG